MEEVWKKKGDTNGAFPHSLAILPRLLSASCVNEEKISASESSPLSSSSSSSSESSVLEKSCTYKQLIGGGGGGRVMKCVKVEQ